MTTSTRMSIMLNSQNILKHIVQVSSYLIVLRQQGEVPRSLTGSVIDKGKIRESRERARRDGSHVQLIHMRSLLPEHI